MFRFDGQTAVVTGAANGMGLAVTELLAAQGAMVCMLDIDQSLAQVSGRLNDGGFKTVPYHCNVADPKEVKEICEEIGTRYNPVKRLVNVAGISANIDFLSPEIDEPKKKIFGVNIDGVWNMCRAIIPLLLESGGGSIVNFSSITGPLVSDPGMSIYSASKAAVSGLSKALAIEFADRNIRVNCIQPGYVWTQMLSKYNPDNPDEVKNRLSRGIPMGRLGTPEEAAYSVLFLLSEEASYITGHDLVMDGGTSLVETKQIVRKGSKKVD